MIREDEICLVLQGLVNGVDYETGESYDFSDTVISSLKIISTILECDKRDQCTIDSVESAEVFEKTSKTLPKISSDEPHEVGNFFSKARSGEFDQAESNDWDIVHGTFKEIIQSIKSDRPNHLVIIQKGIFYEIFDDNDMDFFIHRFGFKIFNRKYMTGVGFPVFSKKVLSDLREMKKSFVLISQLSKEKDQKIRRAISEVYDGDGNSSGVEITNSKKSSNDCSLTIESDLPGSIDNPCIECGCEIPQVRLDNVDGVVRCATCQSRFELANPDSVIRKIKEEGILTREGAKRMRAKQYGTNIHNKN